jgi:uncharacterized protein YdaU (DUF1376 family)
MKPPAFQFYADDFLAGAADMTQSEVGAYILLLCHQWNRGSAPVQPERQLLIAKGPVSEHVLAKFEVGPDGELRNARLEAEREKQANYRETQRLKGIQSGKTRRTTVQPRLNRSSVSVRTGAEPETNSPSPSPINTPVVPKGTLQLRAEKLFNRRVDTPLTDAERRAFRKNKAAIEATSDAQWQALERFYAAPQEDTFSRRDLATLVNNWNGEIDRALKWIPGRKQSTRADLPTTVISAKDDTAA